ncbi:MAG: signal peptidase [Gammaproteobacteria bacterium CG_4_10_14_0_8_um_filter_38_16]|nr:MAG: signal peptidase [Gammaproteobacteria bacterium CG_4_10_14_0_8_um_filter_38_16]PJA04424.1 MAG: signal peptidase [Gammaproteobacteria bacterium CG_4_10_14_0_2_um_filter_38_22]PJB10154.1 MAG: signal peptidase [Gammaproteobacteria bacterium CG_4_9_14_3_um_filter_38_9]
MTKKIVNTAVFSFLTMLASTSLAATNNANHADAMEKCYGIVKAGMNDCQTKTDACAGSATKDNQKDAFLFLPKGDCKKIVGGRLKSDTESEK